MSALTANNIGLMTRVISAIVHTAKASTAIYKGGFLMQNIDGDVVPLTTTAGQFAGIALDEKATTTTDRKTRVSESGEFLATISGVTKADIGKPVFCSTSNPTDITLTWASTTKYIGRVVALEYDSNAAVSNTCWVRYDARVGVPGSQLSYANIADSAEVENTVTETAFDKSKTFDATQLHVGDVIEVEAAVTVNDNNSTDTLTVKLYVGTEEIISTGAVDVADADIARIHAFIVIRAIGASGAVAASGTYSAFAAAGTAAPKDFIKAEAAEDLSATVFVGCKATWSVAHADNEAELTNFVVIHHKVAA